MIFHGNRLLADDSHEISYLIFIRRLGKTSQNLSSAAVVIGALRVKNWLQTSQYKMIMFVMKMGSWSHFKAVGWLPVSKTVDYSPYRNSVNNVLF